MPTDVQSLLLKIDATTELARRELKKMDGDFDTFTRRSEQAAGAADQAFEGFGRAAGFAKASIIGFAAGIGIEGVISFGRAVLDAADSLDAAAEKAGVGVERYQSLKESLRALEVDGDKVDAIFGRLTDTLGAVQGGTAAEGVVRVLDRMGITSRILNGEIDTTDELLDAIAGSAGKFSSQAEFTAAAIDLVGKKLGVDLANAIKDGGVALKAGEASFIAAGGVVDAEYIKKLADANEAVDRFTANSKSKLLIWSGATIGFFEKAAKAVSDFQAKEDAAVLAGIDRALGVTPPKRAAAGAGNDRKADDERLARLRAAGVRGAALASYEADYRRKYGLANVAAPVNEPIITVTASRRSPASPVGARGAPRTRAPAGPAAPSQSDLRQGGFDPRSELAEAVPITRAGLDAISVQLDAIGQKAVDLSNADILDIEALKLGTRLLEDASFAITSGLIGAASLGDALVDTFARAGASLLQSGILNLLSGGAQGTSFGDAFKGLGSLFSGKGFAGGGRPPVGQFSLVGERGPELFMPSVPGTIIPNHMIGGGSGGTVQNFDLRGAVVTEELYARMQSLAAQAAQAGAIGGAQLAKQDSARAARRRL